MTPAPTGSSSVERMGVEKMGSDSMAPGEMKHRETAMASAEGAGAGDPAAGEAIYKRLCVSCHGASGRGDGPVGRLLNPRPSDFTKHARQHGDDYFFKIVQEGGPAVGKSSAMPAWGGQLKDNEILDVIGYLQTFAKGH